MEGEDNARTDVKIEAASSVIVGAVNCKEVAVFRTLLLLARLKDDPPNLPFYLV